MVMTIHKLTAGDGYTYLTRHVAGGDVPRERGQDAADYYTAEGNPPGRWIGSGAALLSLPAIPLFCICSCHVLSCTAGRSVPGGEPVLVFSATGL